VFLFGLGWIIVGFIFHGSLTRRKNEHTLLQEFPLTIISGLVINYGLILIFQSVFVSLLVGFFIAIIGVSCFLFSIKVKPINRKQFKGPIDQWIFVGLISILFLAPIITEPISAWDARSIWFFHAKMIYFSGTIGQLAGWQNPSVAFSHVDYPNLVPALAAQIMHMAGFWNEYLPKASLFYMLVPAICWVISFKHSSFSFGFLLFLIPFYFSQWLWNGYMDGLLAFYFSISMLLFGRYVKNNSRIDLISSFSCLLILLNIKNEGVWAVIAGCSSIFLFLYIFKKRNLITCQAKGVLRYLAVFLIVLLPFILWVIYKRAWNITNDLEIGTAQSFSRVQSRILDGEYKFIFRNIFDQIESPLVIFTLIFFSSIAWSKFLVKSSFPALFSGVVYGIGIFIIYLLTPINSIWHINTSINRTLLPVTGCLLVASFFILKNIEEKIGKEDCGDSEKKESWDLLSRSERKRQ
jgi:hypothetical protein